MAQPTMTRARSRAAPDEARSRGWDRRRNIAAVVALSLMLIGSAIGLTARWQSSSRPETTPESQRSELDSPDFHAVAINPANQNVLLFGHHGGVMRSLDGGRTWNATELAAPDADAMAISFDLSDPHVVFAAGHAVFFRSTDAGRTWTSLSLSLPGTDIHGLARAPDERMTVFAYVVGVGLFRSPDGAVTWGKLTAQSLPGDVTQIASGPNHRIYALSASQGLLRSGDGGKTFMPTAGVRGDSLAAAASGGTVSVGTSDGLLVSTDAGATWIRRMLPGPGDVQAAAVNPANANDVVVVLVRSLGQGTVYRSPDGGETWQTK